MGNEKSSRPVYSTETGRLCPGCGKAVIQCTCGQSTDYTSEPGGSIYLHLERKGRAGKDVTVIKQLSLDQKALKALAKELKSRCGSGGTVSDGNIEIQGNHRQLLQELLGKKGYRVKLSGG